MPGIPICVYKSNMKMFHVTLYKGKSFFSGGFGVIGPACSPTSNFGTVKEIRYEDTITADSNGNGDIIQVGVKLRSVDINGIPFHEKPATKTEASYVEPDITMPTTTAQSAPVDNGDNIYLFLEEALYLQERGLLQVLYETGGKPMDSSHLFSLLEEHDISLGAYLTYAYLRAQTFIVLRHRDRMLSSDAEKYLNDAATKSDKNSNEILDVIDKVVVTTPRNFNTKKRKDRLMKSKMRILSFTASPPQLLHWNDDASTWKEDCVLSSKVVEDTTTTKNSEMIETNSTARSVPIAFDVYSPKSNFKRAHPGIPDYHVSIMCYGAPSPPMDTLQHLIQMSGSIPLRLATVSDSGTVIMFSIAKGEVPILK